MEKYDVIIIGSGMGGLVCGSYLAKAGLRVIIVEQHDKVGGYCTSFRRNGYRFDVGVHYLGGVKKGSLSKIFKELDIENAMGFKQFNPTDKLIMPNNIIYIRNNIDETIKEFKKVFSKDKKNINKFFEFILNPDFLEIYSKTKKMSFLEFLNKYFHNKELQATLEALLGIGNVGLSANNASAISSILLFREFIADPGWYPKGGIQIIPDTLAEIIKNNRGDIILSTKVTEILTENGEAKGVILDDGTKIRARKIVSNADATQTFKKLLKVGTKQKQLCDEIKMSPSFFSVYLGLKNDFKKVINNPATIWFFSTYNISSCYSDLRRIINPKEEIRYLLCVFPFLHDKITYDKPTMQILIPAPFESLNLWNGYRNYLMDKLVKKVEEIIPSLDTYIESKINATPHTFYHYTLNRNGAAYGWASTPYIIRKSVFPNRTSIKNLFLANHWTTGGLSHGGIPQVSAIGRKTARLIMEELRLEWKYKLSVIL